MKRKLILGTLACASLITFFVTSPSISMGPTTKKTNVSLSPVKGYVKARLEKSLGRVEELMGKLDEVNPAVVESTSRDAGYAYSLSALRQESSRLFDWMKTNQLLFRYEFKRAVDAVINAKTDESIVRNNLEQTLANYLPKIAGFRISQINKEALRAELSSYIGKIQALQAAPAMAVNVQPNRASLSARDEIRMIIDRLKSMWQEIPKTLEGESITETHSTTSSPITTIAVFAMFALAMFATIFAPKSKIRKTRTILKSRPTLLAKLFSPIMQITTDDGKILWQSQEWVARCGTSVQTFGEEVEISGNKYIHVTRNLSKSDLTNIDIPAGQNYIVNYLIAMPADKVLEAANTNEIQRPPLVEESPVQVAYSSETRLDTVISDCLERQSYLFQAAGIWVGYQDRASEMALPIREEQLKDSVNSLFEAVYSLVSHSRDINRVEFYSDWDAETDKAIIEVKFAPACLDENYLRLNTLHYNENGAAFKLARAEKTLKNYRANASIHVYNNGTQKETILTFSFNAEEVITSNRHMTVASV